MNVFLSLYLMFRSEVEGVIEEVKSKIKSTHADVTPESVLNQLKGKLDDCFYPIQYKSSYILNELEMKQVARGVQADLYEYLALVTKYYAAWSSYRSEAALNDLHQEVEQSEYKLLHECFINYDPHTRLFVNR